jgi:hypothetical protein
MSELSGWFRNRLACYGAVIAIILQQLDSYPRSTVMESPNPLVRIREQPTGESDWHPDELITRVSGQRYVVVWEGASSQQENHPPRVYRN